MKYKQLILMIIKGEAYRPFDELKELKDVLYDQDNRMIPMESKKFLMQKK